MPESGPQNAIVGGSYGTDLPEMTLDDSLLLEEKAKAKFSRTAEFKRLKEHIQFRIEFYQKMLPDGRPVTAVDNAERGYQWVIANAVIGELNMIIAEYENAQTVVSENDTQRL